MKGPERKIAVNAILLSGSELLSRVTSLVLVIFVARLLGPQLMGIYAFALTLVSLFETAINFGLERYIQREVGRRQELAGPLYATVFQLKFLIFLVSIGVILVLSLTMVESGIKRWVVNILGLSLFFRTNITSGNAFFRACQKAEYEALVVIGFRLVYGAAGLAAILAGQGLITLVSLELLAYAGACCLSWWLFFSRIARPVPFKGMDRTVSPLDRGSEWLKPIAMVRRGTVRAAWTQAWELGKTAKDFFLIYIAVAAFSSANMLMLSALANDGAIGFYSAALRLVSAFGFLPDAITGAFLPVLSQCAPRGLPVFLDSFRPYFKYLLLVGATLAALLGGLADSFIHVVFGPAFKPAGVTLTLLAAVLLLEFTTVSFASALIAQNQEGRSPPIFCVAVLASILLNLALVPLFLQNGTAVASVVSLITVVILQLRALRWKQTVLLELAGTAWRPLLAGALGFMLGKGLTAWQIHPFIGFFVMPPALLLLMLLTGALSTRELTAMASLAGFRRKHAEPA